MHACAQVFQTRASNVRAVRSGGECAYPRTRRSRGSWAEINRLAPEAFLQLPLHAAAFEAGLTVLRLGLQRGRGEWRQGAINSTEVTSQPARRSIQSYGHAGSKGIRLIRIRHFTLKYFIFNIKAKRCKKHVLIY